MSLGGLLPENPMLWFRENPEKLGILVMRTMVGIMWLSMALIKLLERVPEDEWADFNHFKFELYDMGVTHPWSFLGDFIVNSLVPNSSIILVLVLITEFSIGLSLSLGLFTRLGSFFGCGMSLTLFIFTLGWGEWIWTYPLIFMPHFVLLLSRSGRYIGLDKKLFANDGRFSRFLV